MICQIKMPPVVIKCSNEIKQKYFWTLYPYISVIFLSISIFASTLIWTLSIGSIRAVTFLSIFAMSLILWAL